MNRLAAALAIGALAACTDRSETRGVSPKEGDLMTPNATFPRPSIPSIDRAVPATLQTATFALG